MSMQKNVGKVVLNAVISELTQDIETEQRALELLYDEAISVNHAIDAKKQHVESLVRTRTTLEMKAEIENQIDPGDLSSYWRKGDANRQNRAPREKLD